MDLNTIKHKLLKQVRLSKKEILALICIGARQTTTFTQITKDMEVSTATSDKCLKKLLELKLINKSTGLYVLTVQGDKVFQRLIPELEKVHLQSTKE